MVRQLQVCGGASARDFDAPLPWEIQRYFEGYEDGDEVEPPRPPGYEERTPAPDADGGEDDGGRAGGGQADGA